MDSKRTCLTIVSFDSTLEWKLLSARFSKNVNTLKNKKVTRHITESSSDSCDKE